jgi:hypothetical protein
MAMKANRLLKANIDALLRGRRQTRKDLAQWCYRSESWISNIFKEERREFAVSILDRVADFFGVETYQLFQPGITPLLERRSAADRRKGRERRIGHAHRLMVSLDSAVHPYRSTPSHEETVGHAVRPSPRAAADLHARIARLTQQYEADLSALVSEADAGRQAPADPATQPKAPPRHRVASGQHPRKT